MRESCFSCGDVIFSIDVYATILNGWKSCFEIHCSVHLLCSVMCFQSVMLWICDLKTGSYYAVFRHGNVACFDKIQMLQSLKMLDCFLNTSVILWPLTYKNYFRQSNFDLNFLFLYSSAKIEGIKNLASACSVH